MWRRFGGRDAVEPQLRTPMVRLQWPTVLTAAMRPLFLVIAVETHSANVQPISRGRAERASLLGRHATALYFIDSQSLAASAL